MDDKDLNWVIKSKIADVVALASIVIEDNEDEDDNVSVAVVVVALASPQVSRKNSIFVGCCLYVVITANCFDRICEIRINYIIL